MDYSNKTNDNNKSRIDSWYAWWRYSSWFNFGSSTNAPTDPIHSPTVNREVGADYDYDDYSDHVLSTVSEPSVMNALFELLDQFAVHTVSNTDRLDNFYLTNQNHRVVFQFVCHMDGCLLNFVDQSSSSNYSNDRIIYPNLIDEFMVSFLF